MAANAMARKEQQTKTRPMFDFMAFQKGSVAARVPTDHSIVVFLVLPADAVLAGRSGVLAIRSGKDVTSPIERFALR